MPYKQSIIDILILWGNAIVIWAGGEAGRVLIAGGVGGMMRWFMSQRRTLRDGAIAVVAGSVCGYFMWPIGLKLVESIIGTLGDEPESIAIGALAAGLTGMSMAKVAVAAVEATAQKLRSGNQ